VADVIEGESNPKKNDSCSEYGTSLTTFSRLKNSVVFDQSNGSESGFVGSRV
jgi:hypothetical protein